MSHTSAHNAAKSYLITYRYLNFSVLSISTSSYSKPTDTRAKTRSFHRCCPITKVTHSLLPLALSRSVAARPPFAFVHSSVGRRRPRPRTSGRRSTYLISVLKRDTTRAELRPGSAVQTAVIKKGRTPSNKVHHFNSASSSLVHSKYMPEGESREVFANILHDIEMRCCD